MPNYVPGVGPLEHPKLMIIGEAPGKIENELQIPFSGPTGSILNEALGFAGMGRDECYLTNVVKYQPPYNDFKQFDKVGIDVDRSVEELWDNEIRRLKPNCILAVGGRALRAVMGWPVIYDEKKDGRNITLYRGSILTARDGKTKVVSTIHPSALFPKAGAETGALAYTYITLIRADIKRAVEESITPDINLPIRNLVVARNSLDLFRFMRQYEHLDKVAFDIESINCIPVCVGFAFTRNHAISVPILHKIGKHQISEMGDHDLMECWTLIDELLSTKKLVGHNLKYDDYKLTLARFNVKNVYSDTLLKTRVIFPELPGKNLHVVSSLWTREPYYKEEGKEFKLGKTDIKQYLLYNAKDCAVEIEVDEEQEQNLIDLEEKHGVPAREYYYNYMMKKHKLYLEMENNGFNVDYAVKSELSTRYTHMQKYVHDRITQQVGHEVNVKSAPQKIELFKEMGLFVYSKNPTSEDSIVQMIGNHCKGKDGELKKKILEDILEETRVRDQKSRYINFTPDYDGRCKSSFNISATETCRSSTSTPKKPIRPKKMGLAFHTISKHGRLARDIRSMFIPDRGKVFIQADSSQAEARVVAVLSKDWDLLKAFDTIDIHRRTAGLILGMIDFLDLSERHIPGVDEIEKDSGQRFGGKKTRHAGNYDMKKKRFMTEFNTDIQKFEIETESISEWKAGTMLDAFHAASPKIRSVFHADIRDAITSSRTLIDPFGGVRQFHGRMDESLFQEGYANIPQRSVAHLVQGAALKIDEELGDEVGPTKSHPVNWISENHDSLLIQAPENNWMPYALLMKKHMQAAIDFNTYCTLKRDVRLVIPCDIEVAEKSYAVMKKVKF